MYPPKTPMHGIYQVKILAVRQDDTADYIRYDISVGPCVGWATYMTGIATSDHISTSQLYYCEERRGLSDNLEYGVTVNPAMCCSVLIRL